MQKVLSVISTIFSKSVYGEGDPREIPPANKWMRSSKTVGTSPNTNMTNTADENKPGVTSSPEQYRTGPSRADVTPDKQRVPQGLRLPHDVHQNVEPRGVLRHQEPRDSPRYQPPPFQPHQHHERHLDFERQRTQRNEHTPSPNFDRRREHFPSHSARGQFPPTEARHGQYMPPTIVGRRGELSGDVDTQHAHCSHGMEHHNSIRHMHNESSIASFNFPESMKKTRTYPEVKDVRKRTVATNLAADTTWRHHMHSEQFPGHRHEDSTLQMDHNRPTNSSMTSSCSPYLRSYKLHRSARNARPYSLRRR